MINLYNLHDNPKSLYGYTEAFEKVPFLVWERYKKKKHELRKREHLWMQDPFCAVRYAANIIEGRWAPGEDIIITNYECAYYYAHKVLCHSWTKGEPIIATNCTTAYNYAVDVLHCRRFLLGESTIARESDLAYFYAKNVIKGRWKLGEPAIFADSELKDKYLNFIK